MGRNGSSEGKAATFTGTVWVREGQGEARGSATGKWSRFDGEEGDAIRDKDRTAHSWGQVVEAKGAKRWGGVVCAMTTVR